MRSWHNCQLAQCRIDTNHPEERRGKGYKATEASHIGLLLIAEFISGVPQPLCQVLLQPSLFSFSYLHHFLLLFLSLSLSNSQVSSLFNYLSFSLLGFSFSVHLSRSFSQSDLSLLRHEELLSIVSVGVIAGDYQDCFLMLYDSLP